MPQEIFGLFKVVMACLNGVSTFCMLGVAQVALMSASRHADGNLVPLLRERLLANFFGSAAIVTISAYYYFGSEKSLPLASALLIAAVIFPVYNFTDVWMAWLNGKGEISKLALGRGCLAIAGLMVILALGIFGVSSLWIVVMCSLMVPLTQNIICVRHAIAQCVNTERNNAIVRFGRHVTIAMMFTCLLSGDIILLERMHSAEDVAIYAVALLFPEQLKALFSIINQAISPLIYRHTSLKRFWCVFRTQFFVLALVFIVIGLLGYWLYPFVTEVLFSNQYAEAAEHGKLLWLVTAALGVTTYLGVALNATQKPIFLYATYIGYPACLSVLYLLWVEDGVAGLINARIVATVLLGCFYILAFFGYMRVQREPST